MLIWLALTALAAPPSGDEPWTALPAVDLAAVDCAVKTHDVDVRCKKGLCTVEERIELEDPGCASPVRFGLAALEGRAEPLVRVSEGWALPEPCDGGYCVTRPMLPVIEVERSLVVAEGGGAIGVRFAFPTGHPVVFEVAGFDDEHAWDGEDASYFAAYAADTALSKPVAPVQLKDARHARATSVDYYGYLEKGYRHGTWEERHPARHPIAREVVYEYGVRVQTGEWEAHTVVDDEGIARRVPELAACPRDAVIDTLSGGLITQSCTWQDDEGSHALVASFQIEPWVAISIGEALNGQRHGEAREFWPDGSLKERATFYNGREVGITDAWHENGALASRTRHRIDGGIQDQDIYSAEGALVEHSERVPGMGANRWMLRYQAGRLVEERVPVDALSTRARVWRDGAWQIEEESIRRTPPPDQQCYADVDCPGGLCVGKTCVADLDPGRHLPKAPSWTPTDRVAKALAEKVGTGASVWVDGAAIGKAAGCVEAQLDEPFGHLKLRVDGEVHERPLGVASVDADAVTWGFVLTALQASCVETTAYVACPAGGGVQACDSETLVVHPSGDAPSVRPPRAPKDVRDCDASCPQLTCSAEAGRVNWMLRDWWAASTDRIPSVTGYFTEAACKAAN